jgi:glycosyltransferase involved in cell wall biosynthesis
MGKDISIIIPARGNNLGTWATAHSVIEDLRWSDFKYEIVLVTNGDTLQNDTKNLLEYLRRSDRLGAHIHSDSVIAPHAARQRGVQSSTGDVVFFFDNHCLVGRDYFKRVMLDIEKYKTEFVHSTTKFFTGDASYYEYNLRLKENFWGCSAVIPQNEYKPYRIAAGGHGGFAITRDLWDFVGGYGPEKLLVGYGGEEFLLDLKVWLYGREVHIDPLVLHYHYAGNRGYPRHYTDEYYVNMMVCANVIGGEEWLYKVYDSFANGQHLRVMSNASMFDLMQVAEQRSRDYANEVASRRQKTLNELLTYFRHQGVAA